MPARVFWLISAAFLVAAGFHLAALVDPSLGEPSPPWRHALFAAINVAAAVGMLRPPRWFVFPFAALCVQQLYSHGSALVTTWRTGHRVDVASVVVVALMPVALVLLVRGGRGARGDPPRRARAARPSRRPDGAGRGP